jgi:hypothetical protein
MSCIGGPCACAELTAAVTSKSAAVIARLIISLTLRKEKSEEKAPLRCREKTLSSPANCNTIDANSKMNERHPFVNHFLDDFVIIFNARRWIPSEPRIIEKHLGSSWPWPDVAPVKARDSVAGQRQRQARSTPGSLSARVEIGGVYLLRSKKRTGIDGLAVRSETSQPSVVRLL